MSTIRKVAFSLIELMVVIAIVATLCVIAIPSYKSFISRSQVSNAIPLLDPIVNAIKAYYAQAGEFPASASQLPIAWDSTSGGGTAAFLNINNTTVTTIGWSSNFCTNTTPPTAAVLTITFQPGFDPKINNSVGPSLYYVVYYDATNAILAEGCGQWDPSVAGQSISPNLMPMQCTLTDICHQF